MSEESSENACPNCRRLMARIAELEKRVAELERLLAEALRGAKRQAAPFSKGRPKEDPKPPGRKAGPNYGPKAYRPIPDASREPDEIIDVPWPTDCPHCGGRVEKDGEHPPAHQYQVEIPRRPIHRRFDLHAGRCVRCGRRVQGRDPRQTSDAVGSAGSQLGPDAQAAIGLFKNKYGLSYGDIRGIFQDFFGVPISRGGAAQIVLRTAHRARDAYHAIVRIVRQALVVYPDETGWKVGGRLQWLWVFVTPTVTLYVIRPCRGHEVPEEILGAEWAGSMTHDGWSPYDFFARARHQQCVTHLLGRARTLLETATRGAVQFPRKVKALFQDALALRNRSRCIGTAAISPHGLAVARGRLENRLDDLLDGRFSNPHNLRFRNHLARHRDQLFTFLYQRGIEASNWPAEQAIRPAVVNRKVFGGNRTEAGARAQEILATLFATWAQRGYQAMNGLSQLLRLPTEHRMAYIQNLLPVPTA